MLRNLFILAMAPWVLSAAAGEPAEDGAGEEIPPFRQGAEADPPPAAGQREGRDVEETAFPFEETLLRLGHEDFQIRREAQEALLAWGREDLEAGIERIHEVFRRTEDPEIRLRAREVLKRLVIEKQPWGGQGYLGIQMQAAQVKGEKGKLRPAILVTEVREGTAAEEAGIRVGDMILAVDELTFQGVDARLPFGDYIKSRKPGDLVVLSIRRNEEDLKVRSGLRRRSPMLDRITPWGGQLQLPEQSELDEADFREWLGRQEAAEAHP